MIRTLSGIIGRNPTRCDYDYVAQFCERYGMSDYRKMSIYSKLWDDVGGFR